MSKSRPFGVTLLALLAGLAALVAIFHMLQFLRILSFNFGVLLFYQFNLLGAILWGVMAILYIWLVRMLWNVNPQAWLFLAVFSTLNLILDILTWLGGTSWVALLPSVLVNGVILIYCLLPGVRQSFGIQAK